LVRFVTILLFLVFLISHCGSRDNQIDGVTTIPDPGRGQAAIAKADESDIIETSGEFGILPSCEIKLSKGEVPKGESVNIQFIPSKETKSAFLMDEEWSRHYPCYHYH